METQDRKPSYFNLGLSKVDIKTYKASQYNHIEYKYIKCELDDRIKDIGGYKVQRDLYSAFLLMNADDNLKMINKKKCSDKFDKFLSLQEIEVKRLQVQNNTSCIGI